MLGGIGSRLGDGLLWLAMAANRGYYLDVVNQPIIQVLPWSPEGMVEEGTLLKFIKLLAAGQGGPGYK